MEEDEEADEDEGAVELRDGVAALTATPVGMPRLESTGKCGPGLLLDKSTYCDTMSSGQAVICPPLTISLPSFRSISTPYRVFFSSTSPASSSNTSSRLVSCTGVFLIRSFCWSMSVKDEDSDGLGDEHATVLKGSPSLAAAFSSSFKEGGASFPSSKSSDFSAVTDADIQDF